MKLSVYSPRLTKPKEAKKVMGMKWAWSQIWSLRKGRACGCMKNMLTNLVVKEGVWLWWHDMGNFDLLAKLAKITSFFLRHGVFTPFPIFVLAIVYNNPQVVHTPHKDTMPIPLNHYLIKTAFCFIHRSNTLGTNFLLGMSHSQHKGLH